jgi:outer membrane protein
MMKHYNLFFGVVLAFCITGFLKAQDAQSVVDLTIDTAVRIALDSNLNLRRSALDLQTRKRTADRSWNSLLPTISASALASHPTSITGPIEPESRNVWTPGLSLSAGISLSASIFDNIKKAQTDYEVGTLSYESACQELELQVRKLFYQILLLDANRELATQNFASAQARYEQSAALVRIGQAPRLDELSARVDMENMRPTVRNAEMLHENALDSFKTILGFSTETLLRLDGSLSGTIIGSLSGINTASGASLEAANLAKSIQSMQAQRNAIRNGAYIPSLRLSWNSSPLYSTQNKDWNDNGSFSISLSINIDNFFPWSPANTQITNLNDNIQAAQIQLTDAIRNRENRLNQNMRTIERIFESLDAMTLNVELAQTTYEMYEDAYRRGAADYQQLRGGSDSLEQAKNRLLQEQYNLISALLDLEKELYIPFGTLWNH